MYSSTPVDTNLTPGQDDSPPHPHPDPNHVSTEMEDVCLSVQYRRFWGYYSGLQVLQATVMLLASSPNSCQTMPCAILIQRACIFRLLWKAMRSSHCARLWERGKLCYAARSSCVSFLWKHRNFVATSLPTMTSHAGSWITW